MFPRPIPLYPRDRYTAEAGCQHLVTANVTPHAPTPPWEAAITTIVIARARSGVDSCWRPFVSRTRIEPAHVMPGLVFPDVPGRPLYVCGAAVLTLRALLRWPICGRPETGPVTGLGTASVFAGFWFPREVISVAVRWYLRYGLSY